MFTQQKIMMAKSKNILIGCTGSVAAIKLPNIISELKSKDPSVNVSILFRSKSLLDVTYIHKIFHSQIRVVLTSKAQQFVSKEDIAAEVFLDEHEWAMWKKRGDPVLHIGKQLIFKRSSIIN